jgi:hypothetical protein
VNFEYNGMTMKFTLICNVDANNRCTTKLVCAVPPDAPMIALMAYMFPIKSDSTVRAWRHFIAEHAETDTMRYDWDQMWFERGFPCLCGDALVHTGTCAALSHLELSDSQYLGQAILTDNFGQQLMTCSAIRAALPRDSARARESQLS